MKKILILAAASLTLFAACSKEKDVTTAEKVPGGKVQATFIAEVDQTKATENNAEFSWRAGLDTAAVVDQNSAAFNEFICTDDSNGIFTGTHSGAFGYAITPFQSAFAMEEDGGAIMYTVQLKSDYNDYVPGTTNAIMVGTPTQEGNKFLFRHLASLFRFKVENVPVGTAVFELSVSDKNIAGFCDLDATSGVAITSVSNNGSVLASKDVDLFLKEVVTTPNTTLDFYVPVPVGNYTNLTVSFYDDNYDVIKSVTKNNLNINLNRGDVYYTPTITLAPEKIQSYIKVTDTADLEDGDYLIVYEDDEVAFDGSLSTLDAANNVISVSPISNGAILATNDINASNFHITPISGGFSIKSASGSYIGRTSGSNGMNTGATAFVNTISIDESYNAVITSAGGPILRFNSNSGDTNYRFRYYGSGQKAIALYKLGSSTAWTLESISITTPPTKTTYDAGETFDPAGMVVTAHYVDADDNTNTKDATVSDYTISPDGELSADNTEVTISYQGKTATQSIKVINWVLDGIAVTTAPTKTEYEAGEYFEPAGMVVTATYKDSKDATTTKEETLSLTQLTFNPSTSTALTTDITSVSISYTEGDITKTTAQVIKVNAAPTNGWIETAITALASADVFVIVGNNGSNYAMTNDNGTSSAPSAVSVTVTGTKITSEVADNIKWSISGNANAGYSFYPNGNTSTWLYCTNNNNGLRVGTGDDKSFVIDSDYLLNSGQSRYIGIYNSQDWRSYTSINNNIASQTFKFYRFVDSREAAPISWPNATETATKVGSTITWGNGSAPVLSNTENLDVSYSSSNESVATIASNGTISVVGGGSTVIKAFYTGTTYKDTEKTFTLTVTDNTTYTITCNSNNTSYGTILASPASAKANATVTITITPAEGYKLKSISAVDGSDNAVNLTTVDETHRSFTMPASNVTVSANFEIASNSQSVIYTVTSTSAVSVSGSAPSGSSATYSSTYSTKAQLTKNNSMTLSLSGYAGKRITSLVLSMRSNASGGAGYMYIKSGSTTFGSIGSSNSGVAFNNASWHGSWSTSYVDVTIPVTATTVGSSETVEIKIGATANSLYCQSFTITYE